MATYRVFVTRHYIAVRWYDVEADTPRKARNAARKAARTLSPDPRAEATDNGWIADDPVAIEYVGSFGAEAGEMHDMNEVLPGVFEARD